MVQNHTATVEMRSNDRLTDAQKFDAKVALVKKLKVMFTGKFKHYNSPRTAADASNDPAFCAELAQLFATLPGYKIIWGELCVGYKEQLEMKNVMKRHTNTVSITDDAIRDYCKDVARTLTCQIGFLMADGNTSEMCDLERHNKLIEVLVQLVKRFMCEHREYDSYQGLSELAKDEEFKAQMADVLGDALGIE